MFAKATIPFAALVLATILLVSSTKAAPPLVDLVSFNRVEADPDKDYVLSESCGPYLILASSFSGEGAEDQAKQLVLELRKRYKLTAYFYKKRFELTKAQGRGFDSYGDPVKMCYHAGDKLEEVAVLVGDFSSLEDSAAQRTLKTIKYATPKCLDIKDKDMTHQSLAGWRMTQHELMEKIGSKTKDKGPMGHAMIAPNPLLPPEYFVNRGLDKFIVDLNKDLEYSLLKCPGKFTVQVATFRGRVEIDQKKIEEIQKGKEKIGDGLVKAANQATLLTQALRMKGYEAYEFHDRSMSIVTVGSFDSVGMPMSDGRIDLNPKILNIMKTFGATPIKQQVADNDVLNAKLKSLMNINFDIQPMPVVVPKASVSSTIRTTSSQDRIDFHE